MNLLIVIFIFQHLCGNANAEVFTALSDIEDIFHTETLLINTLDLFIRTQEQNLNLLKMYLQFFQDQHALASKDIKVYISNPINTYHLIKRMTIDWIKMENLIRTDIRNDFLYTITYYKQKMKFPTNEDLNGAAVALNRLQNTYKLNISSMVRGKLNGIQFDSELNAADCFELGRQSYKNGDFYHTQLWMTEANLRLGSEQNETIGRSEILEYLAFSIYKQGNIPLALHFTNKLLEITPTHQRALGNKYYYEEKLHEKKNIKKEGENENILPNIKQHEAVADNMYEKLCRKELTTPIEILSKLKCYFLYNNNPFLYLAPFKVEEAYKDPMILIFHDVMSDSEIATIKTMAQPRFKRATVGSFKIGDSKITQYRISKFAWLKEHEHKHIADVSQRVTDMTGLSMETSEELQVVNYGIAGFYGPHYDFTTKSEKLNLYIENRVATVLFYMSDVAQGGATVFPNIQVAIWPKKGTAVFWYNLFPSGDGNKFTIHAACPVLMGSKWVSTKWIHERGQIFLRPCTLERPPPDSTA